MGKTEHFPVQAPGRIRCAGNESQSTQNGKQTVRDHSPRWRFPVPAYANRRNRFPEPPNSTQAHQLNNRKPPKTGINPPSKIVRTLTPQYRIILQPNTPLAAVATQNLPSPRTVCRAHFRPGVLRPWPPYQRMVLCRVTACSGGAGPPAGSRRVTPRSTWKSGAPLTAGVRCQPIR